MSSGSSKYEPSEAELQWEERRKAWLTATPNGQRRASEAGIKRLERLFNPRNDGERKAAKPIIAGIKERLSDKSPLKEPMPLRLMVSLLYTSWLDDGTITQDMLKAGRAGTDVDETSQHQEQKKASSATAKKA